MHTECFLVDSLKNILLVNNMLYLLITPDTLLAYALDRIELPILYILREVHQPKTPLAQNPHELKILYCKQLLLLHLQLLIFRLYLRIVINIVGDLEGVA